MEECSIAGHRVNNYSHRHFPRHLEQRAGRAGSQLARHKLRDPGNSVWVANAYRWPSQGNQVGFYTSRPSFDPRSNLFDKGHLSNPKRLHPFPPHNLLLSVTVMIREKGALESPPESDPTRKQKALREIHRNVYAPGEGKPNSLPIDSLSYVVVKRISKCVRCVLILRFESFLLSSGSV